MTADTPEAAAPPFAPPAETPMPVGPSDRTPPIIPWPAQRTPPPDRTAELEARLAEAEAQLRRARRLESVGRLVAGVAHDFNNLLAVVSGNAELVRDAVPHDHPAREWAETIVSTARTAAGVARQLLAFGRPPAREPFPVDVNAAVRTVERTLRRLTDERVRLDLLLAPGLPTVRVDPGQFDQVVLNLVVNARDALPDGGTITVRTGLAAAGPDRPGWPADRPPGEYVALTVTDTGPGMTEEVLRRACEPFFTTKGDHGTGLGLATVRDIVRAAGGHVEIESAVGWGTSVRAYWPTDPRDGPWVIPGGFAQ